MKIRNNGKVRAATVLQLYIRQHRSSRVPRVKELKAEDLQVWSPQKSWILEAGPLTVSIQDQGIVLWEDTINVKP